MKKPNTPAPLVSVVMPAYNAESFIRTAIESVLMQDINLELLIVNDCSPDNLDSVVSEYAQDSRVIYIKNPKNLGAAQSRNKAVGMARGKYIAFLDSDDWWEKDKLKKQLAVIQNTDTVLCCTGRALYTHDGRPTGKMIPVDTVITYKKLLKHNQINCSSVLIRRKTALEFPMDHEDAHEDYIAWLKILQKYKRVSAINEPLLNYRLSQNSKSGSKWNSARMTYKVYRYMGFNLVQSLFYFISYAIHGVIKWKL